MSELTETQIRETLERVFQRAQVQLDWLQFFTLPVGNSALLPDGYTKWLPAGYTFIFKIHCEQGERIGIENGWKQADLKLLEERIYNFTVDWTKR